MTIKLDAAALCQKYRLDARGDQYLDAANTVFFARQLEEIDAQMYDTKYAKLEAFELVPVKTLHPGAETYTYRIFDGVAVAKMTSNYATGSPRADVSGKEYTARVRGVRNSYGYNVQEIRAASQANLPLENMRAVVARRGVNEKINRVALLGDAEHGLVGLFNQPNIPLVLAGTDGTANPNTLWAGKTAASMLSDLFNLVDSIPTATKEIEHAKRVVMPYPRLRYISRVKIDAVSPITVLQFFMENRPGVEVRGALFLDTASTSHDGVAAGIARMMAYDPARENLELLLPVAFESFPPERRGMEYVIENHARVGGVVYRYPLSAAYMDGI